MLLTRRLPRRPPIVFGEQAVLGGSSLVCPGGATTRRPPAPAHLDLSGYNALSLFFTVSGLGGGQTLEVYLNTQDPESDTGGVVAGNLGRTLLYTASADGSFATTLSLPTALSSHNASPFGDVQAGFWSGRDPGVILTPNLYTCIDEAEPNDTDYIVHQANLTTTYETYLRRTGSASGAPIAWTSLTGYTLRIRAGEFVIPNANAFDQLLIREAPTILWNGAGLIPAISIFSFTTYVLPVTLASLPINPSNVTLMFSCGGGAAAGEVRVPWAHLEGGGGGLSDATVPFYRNLFDFVVSAGSDVTVSAFLAELTQV